MVIDHAGKKLYVNLTGTDEVGVIDLKTRQFIARWPLPDAHVAHAIALDEPNHRLFTATRKPPQFIVFNTDAGKVVTSLPCVGVNSDMSVDVARKRIYVTGSDTASVFEQRDADHYEHIAEGTDSIPSEIVSFCTRAEKALRCGLRQGKARCETGATDFRSSMTEQVPLASSCGMLHLYQCRITQSLPDFCKNVVQLTRRLS